MVAHLPRHYQSAKLTWVKTYAGTAGNERAEALRESILVPFFFPGAPQAPNIQEVSRKQKRIGWRPPLPRNGGDPAPPPKKACMDQARNSIARTAAQIRTGHWRSAVHPKRIKKRTDDKCWFCEGTAKMTRSHAPIHCPNATLAAARVEAWEGRNPKGIRALLSDPRWESRLRRFLELSSVGRYVEGGVDEDQAHAERMEEWIMWEADEEGARRSPGL
jgi:hypothetical protein